MSPLTRREERRANTIQEIKDLAWQQMASSGPGSLSLRQIARQMRMSSPAIFRYFPNREALLEALTADAFQSQNEALLGSQQAQAGGPAKDRLAALAKASRRWALDHPTQYLLIYGAPAPGYRPDWASLAPLAGQGLLIFIELFSALPGAAHVELLPPDLERHLAELIAARGYPVAPPALYSAIVTWSRLHGLVSLELIGQLSVLAGNPAIVFDNEIDRFLEDYAG